MIQDQIEQTKEAFREAAFDPTRWDAALAALAAVTGGRSGQLIGFAPPTEVLFNHMTEIPDEALAMSEEIGQGDPARNPRVRAGLSAPVLQSVMDGDFITPETMVRTPIYREFLIPIDIPFICLTTLVKEPDRQVGLSVSRTARQGHMDSASQAVFDEISPYARAAVQAQRALSKSGLALLSGALDSLALAAFILDGAGRVGAMTPRAEALVVEGGRLDVREDRLRAVFPADALRLETAIAGALVCGSMACTVIVRGDGRSQPWIVDIAPMPRRSHGLSFDAVAVVTVRRMGHSRDDLDVLTRELFGLTAAEARVATGLVRGASLDEIASLHGIGLGTVRTHVRGILTKADVGSQREFVSLMANLG